MPTNTFLTQSTVPDGGNRKSGNFNPANIRFHNYTLSLLDEAYRCGEISESEAASFRLGLGDALAEGIEIYTLGESTSVLTETAGSLMTSLLFSCDAYLMSLNDHTKAIAEIKRISVKGIYERGMKSLRLLVCEAMSMLIKVRRTRVEIPNLLYNEVIDKKAIEYLSDYNVATSAHIGGKFEYPLALACANLRGIHYIKGYLKNLYFENIFIHAFSLDEVQAVYTGFCRRNGFSYSDANINFFTLIFENALICEYLQKDTESLILTREDCDRVTRLFSTLTRDEQQAALKNAADKLAYGNHDYNSKVLAALLPPLLSAISNGALHNHITITALDAPPLNAEIISQDDDSEVLSQAANDESNISRTDDDSDDGIDITQFPY